MIRQRPTFRFVDLRALFVIVALISLCVSKNVGPQFLPLPGLSHQVGESKPEVQHGASRFPSSRSDSFRVPMVSQAQKRSGTEQQPQPLATSALKSAFEQTFDLRIIHYCISTVLLFTSAHVAQPPGRAPPRLV
jgi:hypothetical protein